MNPKRKLTVVAFGAHPDDLEMSMFGTMIKYNEQGHTVHLIVATDGRRSGAVPGNDLAVIRKQEAMTAAAHIGLVPLFFEFPNGHTLYDEKTFDTVVRTLELLKPDIVFTHDPHDYHPEHRLISVMVTDAAWCPVFLADTLSGLDFDPQFYVDISSQFELKKRALLEHKSQTPENLARIAEIQNQFRALQCDFKGRMRFAEAYRLFKRIGSMKAYELLPD